MIKTSISWPPFIRQKCTVLWKKTGACSAAWAWQLLITATMLRPDEYTVRSQQRFSSDSSVSDLRTGWLHLVHFLSCYHFYSWQWMKRTAFFCVATPRFFPLPWLPRIPVSLSFRSGLPVLPLLFFFSRANQPALLPVRPGTHMPNKWQIVWSTCNMRNVQSMTSRIKGGLKEKGGPTWC